MTIGAVRWKESLEDQVNVAEDQEVMKSEAAEEDNDGDYDDKLQWYEWPAPEHSPKSIEGNLALVLPSNSTTPRPPSPFTPSPSSPLGKRKRKPKVMTDELALIANYMTKKKKKKKTTPPTKSKHAAPGIARKSKSCNQEKAAADGLNNPNEIKSPALIRAEEVQSSLGTETPSFLKLLVRSHVAGCFWMGLPRLFCKTNLPKIDTTVVLEDESGEQFAIKYIAEKTGLSAGWRQFAAGHNLLEGDVLIFQLVEPNKFKVYIIRANNLTEVDGALSLLNLDAYMKQNDTGNAEGYTPATKDKKMRRRKSLPLVVVQKKNKKTGLSRSVPQLGPPVEQSGNNSEEVGSEVLGGSKCCEDAVWSKDFKRFDDFHIVVNGVCIDSELHEHTRRKYYELCRSKNAFLHDHLLPGLSCMLVAGIIFETVNTADALRACKLTTSEEEFAKWDKSLESFELLGMNVGFMRARLRWIQSLIFGSEDAHNARRYSEAKTEQTQTKDEIRNLEAKLVELKEASEKLGAAIETLKTNAESYELKFQEEVRAPW